MSKPLDFFAGFAFFEKRAAETATLWRDRIECGEKTIYCEREFSFLLQNRYILLLMKFSSSKKEKKKQFESKKKELTRKQLFVSCLDKRHKLAFNSKGL